MRKILSVLLIFSSLCVFSQSKSLNVLYIGNSYTATNDLPRMISTLAGTVGYTISHDENLPGGAFWAHHCQNESYTKIIKGGWDYVVLQEQSQNPSFPWGQFYNECEPYADILDSVNHVYNPCGRTMYFMTWGHKNGDQGNCNNFPVLCTYEGMDSMLCLRYEYLANKHQADVSPVGVLWHYIRDNYSTIDLYSGDGSHPSMYGSYAAACAFVTVLCETDPTRITDDYSLDPTITAIIRTAAKAVVYDSLSKWKAAPSDSVKTDFSYRHNGLTVIFTSGVKSADSYLWSFGDGNTSTDENPTYNYSDYGEYEVTLEVHNCGKTGMKKHTLILSDVQVCESVSDHVSIAPNPAKDNVSVTVENSMVGSQAVIYDIAGRKVMQFVINATVTDVNVSGWSKGMYLLKLNNGVAKKIIVL